jgi:UDP-GlcNAc:undecaprenyl-phosphate/decaprenyl-phosphate GlcNAc-1-phosphate transferase
VVWVLVSFLAGMVVTTALWRGAAPMFAPPTLARENVRGLAVPTAGGLLLVLAIFVPLAGERLTLVLRWSDPPLELVSGWQPVFVAVLGFGFLGLVDDVLGDGSSRGFGGHLRALRSGTVTTGTIKLLGGGLIAFVATAQTMSVLEPRWQHAVDVALVALAANIANLLDRAPGRVTKLGVLAALALVVAGPSSIVQGEVLRWPPVAAVFVVGGAVGLLVPELRERVMLGDTGANVLGAALGIGAVQALGGGARVGIASVLLVLNLASERVSFSRVIADTPGLRHLDHWGRATGPSS